MSTSDNMDEISEKISELYSRVEQKVVELEASKKLQEQSAEGVDILLGTLNKQFEETISSKQKTVKDLQLALAKQNGKLELLKLQQQADQNLYTTLKQPILSVVQGVNTLHVNHNSYQNRLDFLTQQQLEQFNTQTNLMQQQQNNSTNLTNLLTQVKENQESISKQLELLQINLSKINSGGNSVPLSSSVANSIPNVE